MSFFFGKVIRWHLLSLFLAGSVVGLLSPGVASAGDITVELTVSPQEVTLNDRLQLTVTISGAMRSVPEPQIENLDGFTVVGRSQSSQISRRTFSPNIQPLNLESCP